MNTNISALIASTPNFFIKGPFVNSTGFTMPIYVDMRKVLSFPEKVEIIIRNINDHINKNNIKYDIMAGIAASGIMLSAPLAYALKKRHIIVRPQPKTTGRKGSVEGYFKEGETVLIIDDATSNGNRKAYVAECLRKLNLEPVYILTPFARDASIHNKIYHRIGIRSDSLCDLREVSAYAFNHSLINKQEYRLLNWYVEDSENWEKDPHKAAYFKEYLNSP